MATIRRNRLDSGEIHLKKNTIITIQKNGWYTWTDVNDNIFRVQKVGFNVVVKEEGSEEMYNFAEYPYFKAEGRKEEIVNTF